MEFAEEWILLLVVSVVSGGDVGVTTERLVFDERAACAEAAAVMAARSGTTTVGGVEITTRYEPACIGAATGRVLTE